MYECEERIEEAFGIEFEAASATEGERETPEQASYAASEQGWEVQEARLAVAREEDNEEFFHAWDFSTGGCTWRT